MLNKRNETVINITSNFISGFRDFNNVALSSKLKNAYLSCDFDLAVKTVDEWVSRYILTPLSNDLSISTEQRSNIFIDSKLMFSFIVEQDKPYFSDLVTKLKIAGYVPAILTLNNQVIKV
ncbi:hypothetical protein EIJ81_00815 (plasmid) [Aliivibrio salmonicida]|uniref:hypothetical protein n=1 Tax=Aliivibrio salmonicida TaxID=40269 RepID=UPI000F6D7272|nr:hypothetical protein [Aliivibrio salmonicida]AZL83441.1 hypothetical protein EIJ81_00815 [Aliivibrio salmonicida]